MPMNNGLKRPSPVPSGTLFLFMGAKLMFFISSHKF